MDIGESEEHFREPVEFASHDIVSEHGANERISTCYLCELVKGMHECLLKGKI